MPDATVVVEDATGVRRAVDNETATVGGETVYRQRVVIVPAAGTWGYSAGSGGGTVNVSGRLLAVRAYATGADGTVTINGGDAVTVRQDTGFDWKPEREITDPTLVFGAAIDYFVEFVS